MNQDLPMENEEKMTETEEVFVHKKKSPYYSLVALITAMALFLLSVQAYTYLIHPEPGQVPKLEDVGIFLNDHPTSEFSSHDPKDVKRVLEEVRDNIKQVANFIASKSCTESDRVCQSKAIYYFVRDEIRYVSDANFHDSLENPLAVLKTGGADCEDMAVLLIALEEAIGNKARLVFVPSHAYAQISIPNYKSDQWLNLEGTCKTCKFGELPDDIAIQQKSYTEI